MYSLRTDIVSLQIIHIALVLDSSHEILISQLLFKCSALTVFSFHFHIYTNPYTTIVTKHTIRVVFCFSHRTCSEFKLWNCPTLGCLPYLYYVSSVRRIYLKTLKYTNLPDKRSHSRIFPEHALATVTRRYYILWLTKHWLCLRFCVIPLLLTRWRCTTLALPRPALNFSALGKMTLL